MLALVVSVSANFMLYRQTMIEYSELQRVHLDPTHARVYVPANQALWDKPLNAKRVVMFGDSRIEMWHPVPAIPGCQFVNRGVGGQTTAEIQQRVDRDVIALHPDLVVIEMGVNNLKTLGVFPEREDEIVKSCDEQTDLILKSLSDHHIPVVMLTIFPVGSVPWVRRSTWSDRIPVAVEAYNRRLLELKRLGLTVIDCDPALAVGGRMNPRYAVDTLHVNEAGYGALNQLIEPTLGRLLSQPGSAPQ
jgi:lysophospholipase L1-like esterase